VKEVLSQNNVQFTYMDISSGMLPLKSFLKIRDFNDSHKATKEAGRIGIPALSIDGETYIVDGPEHAQELISKLNLV